MGRSITDLYVIATFALWAGDVEYGQDLLRKLAPLREYGKLPEKVESSEELILYIAALRHRQLIQRKREYNNVVDNYRMQGFNLSAELLTVETRHLRGIIWRLGSREFQMYAYLTDLSWEPNLFRKAKRLISAFGEEKLPSYVGSESEIHAKSFTGSGGSWIVTGNPFLQIHVSDLGLIEALGLWVKKKPPQDVDQIKKAFSSILHKLDGKRVIPGGQTHTVDRNESGVNN